MKRKTISFLLAVTMAVGMFSTSTVSVFAEVIIPRFRFHQSAL